MFKITEISIQSSNMSFLVSAAIISTAIDFVVSLSIGRPFLCFPFPRFQRPYSRRRQQFLQPNY